MSRGVFGGTDIPLTALPVTVRPIAGEHPETYLRRLAAANHLRPSYLRRFAAGPPSWEGMIQPVRLAALSGRPLDLLCRVLPDLGGPGKPAPATTRRRRHAAHPDRSALYAAIRAVSNESRNYMTQRELAAAFRVTVKTVSRALHSAIPPARKPRRPMAIGARPFTRILDALLAAQPDMAAIEIWERITDTTDLKVSYGTVRPYVAATRTIPARYRRDRDLVA